MSVLVVIQARVGSTRLPGKILLPLGPEGKPVLQHVVERAQRAGYPVVVACPWNDQWKLRDAIAPEYEGGEIDDPIEPYAGRDEDVLGRYVRAVDEQGGVSVIVRLTADCPCLDYRLIQRAVEAVQAGHDYAGNTVERHWPRGLDVECFTTELLLKAHQEATDPYDREHVTPWMQRHAVNPYSMPRTSEDVVGATEALRWTLDTPNDLHWLQGAFERFPNPTTQQLLALPPRYD